MTNKTVAFATLGCKVNQYETQAMTEKFIQAGYKAVDFSQPADVYVINTCTVTNMSDRKSRQMIRRAKKQKNGALVVATGCYAQRAPEALLAIGVDLVLGCDGRKNIVSLVESHAGAPEMETEKNIFSVTEFEEMEVFGYADKTRAFIKIQEGCDRFCSYCIIPYARGRVRSRKLENVVAEAKRLCEAGFSEIVLTGIHVASYGKDLGGVTLLDAIKAVHALEGVKRLRLSSIDPLAFDSTFLDAICSLPKLCPHFHISLQSGCAETLTRMNRRYTPQQYREVVAAIRRAMPDAAITTDVICGFPGETQEEFAQSLAFVKSVGFAQVHVFPYSERSGTPAADMKPQVPMPEREARAHVMAEAGHTCRQAFLKGFVGREMEVLIEQKTETGAEGLTANYIRVLTDGGEPKSFVNVRITGVSGDDLTGGLV